MSGYIVETLNPLGWRKPNTVHYRFSDAIEHAQNRLDDFPVRAVRILSFTINDDPVFMAERDDSTLAESQP